MLCQGLQLFIEYHLGIDGWLDLSLAGFVDGNLTLLDNLWHPAWYLVLPNGITLLSPLWYEFYCRGA